VRSLVAFLVAVNPPIVAAGLGGSVGHRRRTIAFAAAVAAFVAVVAAAASRSVLDILDVTAPTFRVATGVVLGVASARWLVVGARPLPDEERVDEGWRGVLVPLVIPLLLTPQLVTVSVSVGTDDGVVTAALGAAAALTAASLSACVRGIRPILWSASARFIAMAGIAVALALAVDGVKSV
jgi:small neutral amino acid transporter SnatA (MarC family)